MINYSHLKPANPNTEEGKVAQAFFNGDYKLGFAQIKEQVKAQQDQDMTSITGTIANWSSISADTTKLFGDALRITRLSKAAVALGNVMAPISVGIEAFQVYKGDVEFGAFLVNTAIVGIGVVGGPAGAIGATAWYVLDPLTVNNPGAHNPSQDEQPFYSNGKKYVRCY